MRRVEMHCAYRAENGECQNEKRAYRGRRQERCAGVCPQYETISKVKLRHNKAACDREITKLTKMLIRRYREEGLTVLQIAMLLDRTTGAVEEILTEVEMQN